MAVSDMWHRTLVYFGIADEPDDFDEDYDDDADRRYGERERDRERRNSAHEDLERSYRERPNVRRLGPRRRDADFDDIFNDDAPPPRSRQPVMRAVESRAQPAEVHLVVPKSFNDAQQIADKFKGKKVAIVHDKQVYGQGLAEAAKKTLADAGVTPAYEGSVNAGERDFSALVARLKQEGIDIVYYGGYHTELGLIVRQARQAGLETRFVGADGLATNEFWSIAGEGGAGTLFTFSADVKAKPSAQSVMRLLSESEPMDFRLPETPVVGW